jgi:hypothetical protein
MTPIIVKIFKTLQTVACLHGNMQCFECNRIDKISPIPASGTVKPRFSHEKTCREYILMRFKMIVFQ